MSHDPSRPAPSPRLSLRHSTARCSTASRSAFTLLELILVMLIMIIIASMTVPSLRYFGQGRRLDDAATELLAVTQWARTHAITEGQIYRLNFDSANRVYFLTVWTPETQQYGPVQSESGRQFQIPDGVSFSWELPQREDGAYIEFQPSGRTDAGKIILQDQNGHTTTILSESATEPYHILPDQPTQ